MQESARLQRNAERLDQCYDTFGLRMRQTIDVLEAQGFRPRIQDAWRSPEDQLKAFNAGHSKLKFGFHNVTGPEGRKEALACDLLDDDNPSAPPTRYLLALAIAARDQGLATGVLWGLPSSLAVGVEAALAGRNIDAVVRVGWDPTHTQATGVTPSEAKRGVRPFGGGSPGPTPVEHESPAGEPVHVVVSGDTLGKIAKRAGITLSALLELNPQFLANPNLVRVGDRIRLR